MFQLLVVGLDFDWQFSHIAPGRPVCAFFALKRQAGGGFNDDPEDEVGEEDLPMEEELMASDEEDQGTYK